MSTTRANILRDALPYSGSRSTCPRPRVAKGLRENVEARVHVNWRMIEDRGPTREEVGIA
jgi:hypothetical protein